MEKSLIFNEKSKRGTNEEFIEKAQNETICLKRINDELMKQVTELKENQKSAQSTLYSGANSDRLQKELETLRESYNLLEKKNKSLVTEIELKQLQINSLEEIKVIFKVVLALVLIILEVI